MAIVRYLFPIAVLAFPGCATMLQGTSQKIPVASIPVGAQVTVNGELIGKAPLVLDLKRKDPATITLQSEGHKPHVTILERKRTGWFWLIPTIYGIPLLFADMVTGAAYVLEPREINIDFTAPDPPAFQPTTKAAKNAVPESQVNYQKSSSTYPKTPSGIGVSRKAIQSIYEDPDIGFNFEFAPLADGTPRVMGTSDSGSGLASVELIGPPQNLTKATFIIFLPNDAPDVVARNSDYLFLFVKLAVPTWDQGTDWVTNNLEIASARGEVRTQHGPLKIRFRILKGLAMATLTIDVEE